MDSIALDENPNPASIDPMHQESMTSGLGNAISKTEAENNSGRPTHPLSSSLPNQINSPSQSTNSMNHSYQSTDSQSQSIPSTSSSNSTSIHQSISNPCHHHQEGDGDPSPTPSPILSSLSLFNHSHPSNPSYYTLSPLIQRVDEADIHSLFHQLDSHHLQSGNVTQSSSLDKGKGREIDIQEGQEDAKKDSLDYKTISNQLAQISRSVQDPNQKSQLDQLVQTLVSFAQRKEEREEQLGKKLQSLRIQALSLLTKSFHSNSSFSQSQSILQDQLLNEIETLRSSIKILTTRLNKSEELSRQTSLELSREREREREREKLREKERLKEKELRLMNTNGSGVGNQQVNWNWKLNQNQNGGSLNGTPIRNQIMNPNVPFTELSKSKIDGRSQSVVNANLAGSPMDLDPIEHEVGGMMGPPVSNSMSQRPSAPPALGSEGNEDSNSNSNRKDVEQSPTPLGGDSSSQRPNINNSGSSQRLGEALELVSRSPIVGSSSGGLSASNSNESLGTPSRAAIMNRTKSVDGVSSGKGKSKVQSELEEKAEQSHDLSLIGDTDLTLDRQTLLKERSELTSDKRYLKQRLFDAEAQLVRFEDELRNVRSILLSKGQFIEITKSALMRNDDYSSALNHQKTLMPSMDMDLGTSPYSQVYLNGKTFAERERLLENSQGEEIHGSSSTKKNPEDFGNDFSTASNLRLTNEKEIRKRNKKSSALMGDAETEHLLLAAKRLRELKEMKEETDLRQKLEARQRHKERKEQREREERDRYNSEGLGTSPFYPEPNGGISSLADNALSPVGSSRYGGGALRTSANNYGDYRNTGPSIFPSSSQTHSSTPNSVIKSSSVRKGSSSRSTDRPRTPPRERIALQGSPLKRGGSPMEASAVAAGAPRTPGSIASRAFPTPGTTPGSAMDDLLHAAQTVLTPTDPRAEINRQVQGEEARYSTMTNGNVDGLLRSPLSGRAADPSTSRTIQVLTPGRREGHLSSLSRSRPSGNHSPSGYASDEQLDSSARKRRRTQTAGGDFSSEGISISTSGPGLINGSLNAQAGIVGGLPDSIIRTRPRSGTDVNVFHQATTSTSGAITNPSSPFQFNPIVQGGTGIIQNASNGQRRIGIGIDIPNTSYPTSDSISTPTNFSQPMSSLSALDLLADQAHAAASQNPSQSSENSLSRSQTDEEIGNLDSEDDDSESDSQDDDDDDDDDDDVDAEGEDDPDRTTTTTTPTVTTKSGRKSKSRNEVDGVSNPRESKKRKRRSQSKGKKKAEDSSSSNKSTGKRNSKRKLNSDDNDSSKKGEESSVSNGKKPSMESNRTSTANEATSSPSVNDNSNKKSKSSSNLHSRSSSRNGSIDLTTPQQKQSPALSQTSKSKEKDTNHDPKEKDDERETMSAQQRGAEKRVPYVRWSEEEDKKLRSAVAQFGQRWELIARSVKTRTYHQCRQRFLLMRRKEAQKIAEENKGSSSTANNLNSKTKKGGGGGSGASNDDQEGDVEKA